MSINEDEVRRRFCMSTEDGIFRHGAQFNDIEYQM